MAIFIASQVCATTFILVRISFFFYFRKCYKLNTRLLAARTPSFVGVFFEQFSAVQQTISCGIATDNGPSLKWSKIGVECGYIV